MTSLQRHLNVKRFAAGGDPNHALKPAAAFTIQYESPARNPFARSGGATTKFGPVPGQCAASAGYPLSIRTRRSDRLDPGHWGCFWCTLLRHHRVSGRPAGDSQVDADSDDGQYWP